MAEHRPLSYPALRRVDLSNALILISIQYYITIARWSNSDISVGFHSQTNFLSHAGDWDAEPRPYPFLYVV